MAMDLGVLKRYYGKGSLLYQQNLTAYLLNNIPVSDEPIGGEGRFKATYFSGNEAGGAINPGEALATADDDTALQPYIVPKLNHWPIEFTGREFRQSKGNEAAFARLSTSRVQSALKRINSDRNRQYWGDATGTLTQVNGAVVASATVVVDDVQYLRVGQHLDIFATLGGAKEASNVKIATITVSTNTITLGTVVTLSDNAILVKTAVQDNIPSGSDGKEITGLSRIVDTTTSGVNFQGLDRSVYTDYQSNVISAAGAPPSQALLERLLRRIEIVGGSTPTKIMSRHGVYSSFVNTVLPQSRFTDDKIKAGHVAFTWNGIEWMLDKDCPKSTIFMLDMKPEFIARYVLQETDLADLDTMGQKFGHKQGFDKNYAYYISDENLGSDKPNSHGKLTLLAEPLF